MGAVAAGDIGRVADARGVVTIIPIRGVPEVRQGDDLATLFVTAARDLGVALADGDVVVVSSKVLSKSLGLWSADRDTAIRQDTVRVVAERRSGPRVTQIVESVAGPVMAAAGVDASNTGGRSEVLRLPEQPDSEAERLRQALVAATGLTELGVVVSDTAGRRGARARQTSRWVPPGSRFSTTSEVARTRTASRCQSPRAPSPTSSPPPPTS